jgi:hypothetical protein
MKGEAMNHDANEFWAQVSPGLRRHLDLTPPTYEEAEAEFQSAQAIPLTEEEKNLAFLCATTGRQEKRRAKRVLPKWLENIDLSRLTEEMVPALARNAGATDDEVEELLRRLRQEALEDEDQVSDGENDAGTQDKAEPGEEGS